MFERYTDEALLVLASARIEAIKFGSRVIEPEHLLLGILREPDGVAGAVLAKARVELDRVREQFERRLPAGAKIPTGIDIPLSDRSKAVLAFAEMEAKSLLASNIGAEHLLLGILRDPVGVAREVLAELGVELLAAKTDVLLFSEAGPATPAAPDLETLRYARDLTEEASRSGPCVGRDAILNRIGAVLARRSSRLVLLVGEPGSGRTCLVEALAKHPPTAAWRFLAPDLARVAAGVDHHAHPASVRALLRELRSRPAAILVLDGSDEPAGPSSHPLSFAWRTCRPLLDTGTACVATTTPEGLRELQARDRVLMSRFTVIRVESPGEADAAAMVGAVLPLLVAHHRVDYDEATIPGAVRLASCHVPTRALPGSATDLLDEAGAVVAQRAVRGGPSEAAFDAEIQTVVSQVRSAIKGRDFPRAILHRDREIELRKLRKQQSEAGADHPHPRVRMEDVAGVVAARTGLTVAELLA